jgi:hypothetical protein
MPGPVAEGPPKVKLSTGTAGKSREGSVFTRALETNDAEPKSGVLTVMLLVIF